MGARRLVEIADDTSGASSDASHHRTALDAANAADVTLVDQTG